MKQKQSRLRRLIIIAIPLVTCSLIAYVSYHGIMGPPIPPSQVISEKDNLCLDFRGSLGSEESVLMFTHRCNIPVKIDQFGIYDEKTYLDMWDTMECPQIEVVDKDNDGLKEIYAVQDAVCKEFAHPMGKDPKKLILKISKDGKFIVIESQ